MSNSALVSFTQLSPTSHARISKIDRVTIHHVAGIATAEALGDLFSRESRQASSNYGIGNDGKIGMYVPEARRSVCSNNWRNDDRAITIEVSNSEICEPYGEWPVSDAALESLINLLVDICQRNPGIGRLRFTGDTTGNMTMHKWFAATACPGPYLGGKFPYIEEEVNRRLDAAEKAAQPPTEEETEMRYNTLEEVPDYAKETVSKLVDTGALKGTGEGLNLSEDMVRMLVILDRMGKL